MLKIKDYTSINQQIYVELPSIKPISISNEINQSGQLLISSDESDKKQIRFTLLLKVKMEQHLFTRKTKLKMMVTITYYSVILL